MSFFERCNGATRQRSRQKTSCFMIFFHDIACFLFRQVITVIRNLKDSLVSYYFFLDGIQPSSPSPFDAWLKKYLYSEQGTVPLDVLCSVPATTQQLICRYVSISLGATDLRRDTILAWQAGCVCMTVSRGDFINSASALVSVICLKYSGLTRKKEELPLFGISGQSTKTKNPQLWSLTRDYVRDMIGVRG